VDDDPHASGSRRFRPVTAEPIEIVAYDAHWASAFREESERLAAALGDLAIRIDHVGSTSIPGLSAKPVIDIQISVAALHPMDPYRERLAQAGYHHQPHPDDVDYPFFHKPRDWPHSHHVHVCAANGNRERHNLAFCGYLRDHPELAAEYERLKRKLAGEHSASSFESRNAYSSAKSTFIRDTVKRALSEGYPLS